MSLRFARIGSNEWVPLVNDVPVVGLSIVCKVRGTNLYLYEWAGTKYDTLLDAMQACSTTLEIPLDQGREPTKVFLVLGDDPEAVRILYAASTAQRAAEWALDNGNVAAPIIEMEVDS